VISEISDEPAVWQLQSPNIKIADEAADVKSLAKRYCWSSGWSMYFDQWSATGQNAHILTLNYR
jgi:hypothetical protein